MYYMDAAMENQRGQDTCAGNKVPSVTHILPEDSDTPLPPNPVLEEDAKGHSHKVHMQEEGENPEISGPQNFPSNKGIFKQVKSGNGGDGGMPVDSKDNHYFQGNRKLTASDSKSDFDDYSSLVPRPDSHLLSYYDYPDYYDIMRQRSRVKKPMYDDLMGSRMNSFTDFNDPDMMSGPMMAEPSKSRNRNKFFEAANRKYNDFGAGSPWTDSAEDHLKSKSDAVNLLNPPHDLSDNLNSKGSKSNQPRESTRKPVTKPVTTATTQADKGISQNC